MFINTDGSYNVSSRRNGLEGKLIQKIPYL